MHNKHILSLLALFILLLMGCGADKNMKKGEEYLAIGEYFDAANQFKQAYRKTPTKDRPVRGLRAPLLPIEMLSDTTKLPLTHICPWGACC